MSTGILEQLKNIMAKENPLAAVYSESDLLKRKFREFAPLPVPMMNVAFSGKWNGGLTSGITVLAGESKMGKTFIGLVCVKAYLDAYEDSVCIYLDSEAGAGFQYFERLGIPQDRVFHIPVEHIEAAKTQLTKILDTMKNTNPNEKKRFIVFFDSLGNIASKKECEDAVNGKIVADMTRAKAIKSFFRVTTPYINLMCVPMVVVAHTYKTQDLFPTDGVGRGTGSVYSADTVLILSKSKETGEDKNDITGFRFRLKVHKSRFVVEGRRFELVADFQRGIDTYSDLFAWSLEHGYITMPTKGFYLKNEKYGDPKKYRRSEIDWNPAFWTVLVNDPEFVQSYEKSYAI